MAENKSITEKLESIKERVCDEICKYPNMKPPKGKGEDWLFEPDAPCATCPLNEL